MILDKDWEPRAFIIGNQTSEVSTWTGLSTKFIEWLIGKKLLSQSKLPIYNYAKNKEVFH